nr:9,13-epoxy-labd-14-ene hydroxylase [Marrubium vulgare]
MEKIQILYIVYTVLIPLFLLWCIKKWFIEHSRNKNSPPSPPKLPIIGNLHQIGRLPHRDLQAMARKHGPLMLLHFGSVPVLIASSADTAREFMKTHDVAFASRPVYKIYEKLVYGCKDISAAPYGEYWRQLRSIFVLQLLSSKKVQSFRYIREEETDLFVKKIRDSGFGPVNLSRMFAELSSDGICRAAVGRKCGEMRNGKRFLNLLSELMEIFGEFPIEEFVPWLGWISRVNGTDRRVDRVAKEMDEILESVIEEHVESKDQRKDVEGRDGETILDILLRIHSENSSGGVSIDRDSVKALILDIFNGGTDTISTALEWAMTELLRHPIVMKKLQKEVREIVKNKQDITDEDLGRMSYLKAVIKETLRTHPPIPLLVPRIARNDVKVKGYDVSAKTVVMINAWAIGRDPASWDEPEKFKPERFLDSTVDFKGLDFELIPFGAGRRGCPGVAFADATMQFVLANVVQKFNWKLANGVDEKDLDMGESPGVTAHRSVPLLAVASVPDQFEN